MNIQTELPSSFMLVDLILFFIKPLMSEIIIILCNCYDFKCSPLFKFLNINMAFAENYQIIVY